MPVGIKITYNAKYWRKVGDTSKITIRLHQQISRIWNDAIRAYIRTVVFECMKADTGMSMGSLVPLARAVRMATEVKSFALVSKKRGGVQGIDEINYGGYSPYAWKTVGAGIRRGKNAYKIDYGTPGRPRFLFTFEIPVLQFLLQENGWGYKNNGGAWNSLERGRSSFIASINEDLPMLDSKIKQWVNTGDFILTPQGT